MALQKQLYQIPFSAGLDAKTDVRAKLPPALDIALDVEFDSIKGLSTRKPFLTRSMGILGGGTVTTPRRIVENGDELLLFTDTALYSWVAGKNLWALRDTYLAVAVDEEDVFGVNGDQTSCDRAELNNTVLFAWVAGGYAYLAALDKVSGSVVMPPTRADVSGIGANAVRLIALNTKVLMIWRNSPSTFIAGISIDPANVASSIVIPTSINATASVGLDAVQIPGTDAAIVAAGQTSAQYEVYKVTSAMVVTTSTKARGGNGPIAVAVDPTGTYVQVVRNKSTAATAVTGDLLTLSTLADTANINQAIGTITGTAVSRITAAYRLTQTSGSYQCHVFWSQDESGLGYSGPFIMKGFTSRHNWANTAGALGTQNEFVKDLGIASRAFGYGDYVYFIGVFAGQMPLFGGATFPGTALQNTNLLYRDDGRLVGKCMTDRAGGFTATNVLPGIVLDSGTAATFRWSATGRRVVPLAGGNTYSGRAPCDVAFTFDDDRARRCVRLGKTLYISGSIVMQYDGAVVAELGFTIYPWDQLVTTVAGPTTIAAGNYANKTSFRWTNAVGEVDRSTTATVSLQGVTATTEIQVLVKPLYVSLKLARTPTIEVWRTMANPTADSPFYLVTSQDPTSVAAENFYIPNDPTQTFILFRDGLPDVPGTPGDAAIIYNEAFGENGSVLENLAPPSATIIANDESRIFLAGVANQPDTVWYSKTRDDGHVASFNDFLTFLVPSEGGDITGIAFIENGIVVFRETGIYAFSGDGYDNASGGNNYQLSKIVAVDCGAVSADAIATHDTGVLFKSNKGWYMLDRGFNLQYVGAPVSNYDGELVVAATVLTAQHQIRVLTESRCLVFDFLVGQWAEWSLGEPIDACLYNGTYTLLDNIDLAVKTQLTTYTGVTYGMDVETAWIKLADLQGFARVYKYQILGEYESDHHLRIRFAYNYQYASPGVPLYTDDVYWTPYPTTVGSSLQVQVSPSIQQVESVKVRITASNPAENGTAPTAGASLALTGIGLEVGLKQGLYKLLAAAQRR